MDIIARLDDARTRCNVLDHPFYQRWSAGELSADELRCYAGEYRLAVLALADCSTRAASQATARHSAGLALHASEEQAHVALWDDFTRAVGAAVESGGGTSGERPLEQTRECVQAWTAGEDLLESLATLYAIEASQPQISQTKLDGLREHYGMSPESAGAAYFKLHAELDVEHAREASELIRELMPCEGGPRAAIEERMLSRAQAALEANWRLLDGVDEQRQAS